MKFFREKNDEIYSIASMQARVFERSSKEGLNSHDFIMAFMHSKEAMQLDIILFDNAGLSERELYSSIKTKISNIKKRTAVYPENIMHWIGFFYRYASYLTGVPSFMLYKKITPKYLYSVYPAYHSLEISKAVSVVFDDKSELFISPQERGRMELHSNTDEYNYIDVKKLKELKESFK